MNNMKINVLWIDDQYKIQYPDFASEAEFEGIYLTGFESHEEGIEELEKNLNLYDAIILDAKVKNYKSDTDTGLTGLAASRDYLNKLNAKGKYLPYFIFTGQPDYSGNEMFRQSYGDFYIKGDENQKLWDDIKNKVTNKEIFKLKNKYNKILDFCDDNFLSKDYYNRIFSIIESLESATDLKNLEDLFLPIRKTLEGVFKKLSNIGLIPQDISFNQVGYFITNRNKNFEVFSNKFHPTIANYIEQLILFIQDVEHDKDDLKLKADEYIRTQNNDFLYKSIVYQFLDFLTFSNKLIMKFPNVEENLQSWKRNGNDNEFEGVLDKDNNGNYFCGEFLITYKLVNELDLKIGDSLKIYSSLSNTKAYSDIYKKMALKLSKL
ncbi:MAG: hypothetical protein CFE21_18350 [Bacteroidetes bacterium B1(2017)]|nr:MAG: hypothetical protein CFE21_18350 [Bacteroidetes bacterium B1(2017)]